MRTTRKIVTIDEDKYTGYGLCVPACREGALQVIDGGAASKITLLQVHEAVEGRYKAVKCFAGKAKCPWDECIMGGNIERITGEFPAYLNNTTLSQVTKVV